jgi:hypothetical protein
MKDKKDRKTKESKAQAAPTGSVPQPNPVTPGITKAMVRQHAFELYRDKLTRESMTLQDWVLAEKDLVQSLEADNIPK